MGFSRQEYWSGLLFPPLGDLPNSGIKPRSSALWADSLLSKPPGKEFQDPLLFRDGSPQVRGSCWWVQEGHGAGGCSSLFITHDWSPWHPPALGGLSFWQVLPRWSDLSGPIKEGCFQAVNWICKQDNQLLIWKSEPWLLAASEEMNSSFWNIYWSQQSRDGFPEWESWSVTGEEETQSGFGSFSLTSHIWCIDVGETELNSQPWGPGWLHCTPREGKVVMETRVSRFSIS